MTTELAGYLALAEDYFESQRYADFVARNLGYLDERVLDWVCGPDFDDLIVSTVKATYPKHEQERSSSPISAASPGSGPPTTPGPTYAAAG